VLSDGPGFAGACRVEVDDVLAVAGPPLITWLRRCGSSASAQAREILRTKPAAPSGDSGDAATAPPREDRWPVLPQALNRPAPPVA
ncbi:hypothetical protein STRTUCAR8_05143, partial [Streptomyces turgidiscabies Car8]